MDSHGNAPFGVGGYTKTQARRRGLTRTGAATDSSRVGRGWAMRLLLLPGVARPSVEPLTTKKLQDLRDALNKETCLEVVLRLFDIVAASKNEATSLFCLRAL